MLKSTYRPLNAPEPLPPGWTEHKAPTGHSYYYNASTNTSTYTRPTAPQLNPQLSAVETQPGFLASGLGPSGQTATRQADQGLGQRQIQNDAFQSHRSDHSLFQRRPPIDRPKSKHQIPGCEPWLLVKTKLGRRFVYNPEAGESFWKFPPEVMRCVVEFDRLERERKEREERGEKSDVEDGATPTAAPMPNARPSRPSGPQEDSDEYEEVEVTDDEDDHNSSKRHKTEDVKEDAPVEFNEDDIAYQLTAMGQDYGLDPGEYGDGEGEDWEEGAEGLPLTEEDSVALFKDLLSDFHIHPYTPWEKLIEEGHIIEDDRYTCLSSMKARKGVWDEWSRERIQQLKEQREKEAKKDPRIPYLAFLQKYATPKLYWPEFRRKYKKEPEMRDVKFSDKDREKFYRDYINRLKLPESTLKSDFSTLLKSLSLRDLNRSTSLEALPPALLTDIRYVSLRPQIRDPLIEAYITIQPPAPEQSDISPEEEAQNSKRKKDRERREQALAARENMVREEKRKQRGALQHSKGMLRDGEIEIERALRVGREGLLGHMEVDGEGRQQGHSVED